MPAGRVVSQFEISAPDFCRAAQSRLLPITSAGRFLTAGTFRYRALPSRGWYASIAQALRQFAIQVRMVALAIGIVAYG